MKQLSFLSAILMLVLASSCNMQVKKERLQQIDSLGIHLNYVSESMAGIDLQLLDNRLNKVKQISAWVWDNVEDTLPKQEGMALGDLMRTEKYLNQAKSRYREVSDEYTYSQEQLAALRKDVESNFYSEEEFDGYFSTESNSIQALVSATDELKNAYDYSGQRYEKYLPIVEPMIDSIKAVIYSDEQTHK